MTAKHTPGPWTVGRMQRSSNFAKDTFAVQGDGTVLCRVKGGVTEDAGIAEANALLIAAAPDLLALAKAHEAWEALLIRDGEWERTGDGLPTFTDEIYEAFIELQAQRNAAILKATGERS